MKQANKLNAKLCIGAGIMLFTLSACGFEPMAARYDTQSHTGSALPAISIDPIPERAGQVFKAKLEDVLRPGAALNRPAEYRLHVNLGRAESPAIIAKDGSILRYSFTLSSNFTLSRIDNGAVIGQGNINRTGTYNSVPNAYFSTYVSRGDTEKRLSEEIAEEYRMRLATILANNSAAAK